MELRLLTSIGKKVNAESAYILLKLSVVFFFYCVGRAKMHKFAWYVLLRFDV